jgi:MFS superfamily sulfate permease-like transporter
VRRRIYGAHIRLSRFRSCWNEQCLASIPLAYSYRIQFLTHDLFAGVILAAIAIPEQMATARLGGFTPQVGFFAFLAGSLAFAMFGSDRLLSCGADSTITPIFA